MTAGPESRFTAPRPDCPHPGRWTSTDGDSTEVEVSELVGAFVRALQPDWVVESGSAWGQTSEQIGIALARNGHGRLATSEVQPDRVAATRERCKTLPVEVFEGPSLDYCPPGPVGFAWLDSYEDPRGRPLPPVDESGVGDRDPRHRTAAPAAPHPHRSPRRPGLAPPHLAPHAPRRGLHGSDPMSETTKWAIEFTADATVVHADGTTDEEDQ